MNKTFTPPAPSAVVWNCDMPPSRPIHEGMNPASRNPIRHTNSLRGKMAKSGNHNPAMLAKYLFKDFGIRVAFVKSDLPGHVGIAVPPNRRREAINAIEEKFGRTP